MTHSFRANLNGTNAWVVLVRKFKLEAHVFSYEKPFLNFVYGYDTKTEIEAAQVVSLGATDAILLLSGGCLDLLVVTSSGWERKYRIQISRDQNQQETLEGGPTIMCSRTKSGTVALIHQCQGFFTLVNIDHLRASFDQTNRKRPKQQTAAAATCIGDIVIKLMCWVNPEDLTFAVVYRDFEFNYLLRIYKIDVANMSVDIVMPLQDFSDAPSLVFPAAGGVVVASDLALYYFNQKTMTLEDSAGTLAHPVSHNHARKVITLDMSGGDFLFMGSVFQAHGQIAAEPHQTQNALTEERHVLIADTGYTLLVYLKAKTLGPGVALHDFLVVEMGKSTIARSLVHIEANVFLALSKLSQSVLFRILPTKPYIHVFGTLQLSPPVLDIAITSTEYEDIVAALGGFYSGELERFDEVKVKTNSLTAITLPLLALRATLGEVTGDGFKFIASGFDKAHEYSIKSNSIDISIEELGEQQLIPDGTLSAKTVLDSVLTVENDKLSYVGVEQALPGITDPCSLSILERDYDLDVVVCLTSNTVCRMHYRTADSVFEVMEERKVDLSGSISAALVPFGHHEIMTVIVSSSGEVIQSLRGEDLTFKFPSVDGPMRVKSCNSVNPTVLLFDSSHVWILHWTESFLNRTLLATFSTPISDCLCVGDQNQGNLVLFHGTNEIHLSSYERAQPGELTKSKYYSNHTVLKVIKLHNVDFLVSIELRMDAEKVRSGSKMVRRTVLKLYRSLTLEELFTFGPAPATNYADICELQMGHNDAEYLPHPTFVVADNNNETLLQFSIQDLKIVQTSSTPYILLLPGSHGRKSNMLAVQLLSFHDGILTLVGDRFLRTRLLFTEDDTQQWVPVRESPTLSFGIGYANVDGVGFVGDAVNGIMVDFGKGKPLAEDILPSHRPSFLTALAGVQSKKLLVYGDSVGNLAGLKVENMEAQVVFATNLGLQINVIRVVEAEIPKLVIGTSEGAIYTISDLGERGRLLDYLAVKNHESWRSMKGKDEREFVFGVRPSSKITKFQELSSTDKFKYREFYHTLAWAGFE